MDASDKDYETENEKKERTLKQKGPGITMTVVFTGMRFDCLKRPNLFSTTPLISSLDHVTDRGVCIIQRKSAHPVHLSEQTAGFQFKGH